MKKINNKTWAVLVIIGVVAAAGIWASASGLMGGPSQAAGVAAATLEKYVPPADDGTCKPGPFKKGCEVKQREKEAGVCQAAGGDCAMIITFDADGTQHISLVDTRTTTVTQTPKTTPKKKK